MTLRPPSWFTGKRLQTRLILWTGVILIVSITTASEIRTRYNIHLLEANLQVRSETLVEALKRALGHMASAPDLDIATLETRLREFVDADRTLTRLEILQSNNGSFSLLATSSDQRVPAIQSVPAELRTRIESIAGERVMVTSAPLEGTPFSLVALSSLENIDRYQEVNRWITPAFSLFLIAIVLPPMFLLYSRTISRRFDELLEGIRRAQQGEAAQIPDDRQDEIGAIARTLNDLLTQVRTFNDGLQREVSRATQDLHKRNLTLEETSRQMLAMQRQLLESERLATVGQMAATFAHEIGSPMSSLSAHVQLLLEDYRLSEDQRETLIVVREQIQAVVQIVNDLLRSARRGPSDFVLTDLNGIIETVVRLVQPKLTSQKIDVVLALQPVPCMRGYPLYLQEVFLNLINNASEAMPAGGRLEIRSWFDERRALLNVSIFDTGPGIDPSVVEKMFDHFVTTKAIGAGTGLGLGIVKEIVDNHRGTVHIAPMGGMGTSAHLTFPAEIPVVHAV
jgi:signal transduction histidine kinase